MSTRADALELARFLAFDGREAGEIARELQAEFGLSAREAGSLARHVLEPSPEPPPADLLPTDAGF